MTGLVLDANVLIDYAEADRRLFRWAGRRFGRLVVTRPVLHEVHQLTAAECAEVGVAVARLTDAQAELASAESRRDRAISVADASCLVVAHEMKMACVTNDRPLRAACHRRGVPVVWGLGLILRLVEAKVIEPAHAATLGRRIHELNPFVTDKLLRRYLSRIQKG